MKSLQPGKMLVFGKLFCALMSQGGRQTTSISPILGLSKWRTATKKGEKQKMAGQDDIPIKIPMGASCQTKLTFRDQINMLGF